MVGCYKKTQFNLMKYIYTFIHSHLNFKVSYKIIVTYRQQHSDNNLKTFDKKV